MHVERKVRKEVMPQRGSAIALRSKVTSGDREQKSAQAEEQATSLPGNWFPLPFKVFTFSAFFQLHECVFAAVAAFYRLVAVAGCRLPSAFYFVCEYARLRLVDVATLWQLIACNCSCCTSKSSARITLCRVACREHGSRFLTHFLALPVAR